VLRGFLELVHLIVIDVRPLTFREPIHKKRPGPAPEKDDGPLTLRSSMPWPGYPLFDDLATKVSVNLAPLGPSHSFSQNRIRYTFLTGKALEPP
jgi:hypothetical protein